MPQKDYKDVLYVRRKHIGDAVEFGYEFQVALNNAYSSTYYKPEDGIARVLGTYTVIPELNVTPPEEIADPRYTHYDRFTIAYDWGTAYPQAGAHSNDRLNFRPIGDSRISAIRIYRNIERDFEIQGVNNRHTGNHAAWSFSKDRYDCARGTSDNTCTVAGNAWKYIAQTHDFVNTTPLSVRTNQEITSATWVEGNPDVFSRSYDVLIAGAGNQGGSGSGSGGSGSSDRIEISTILRNVDYISYSRYLNKHYKVTLTLPTYQRHVLNSNTGSYLSDISTVTISTLSIDFWFEVRYPHFIQGQDIYLLWDNNWTQHAWLLTNPDAVISIQAYDSANLTCNMVSPYSSGDGLVSLLHPLGKRQSDSERCEYSEPYHSVYPVIVRSSVPAGIAITGTVADDITFNVVVAYKELLCNEIIPKMAATNRKQRISLEEVSSLPLTVSNHTLFDRDNTETVSVGFTANGINRFLGIDYDAREKTCSFTVDFDCTHVIRSWSYSIKGERNIACGFLIEGWLDGINRWETISAVSNFSTLAFANRADDIIIDYVTVKPRPWNKLRITVTQVTNSSGSLVGRGSSVAASIGIGKFQFYEGYPMLKRISSLVKGSNDRKHLNTQNGNLRYIASNSEYTVMPLSDGRLTPTTQLSGSLTDTGIADAGNYTVSVHYWPYDLINTEVNGLFSYTSNSRACMGLNFPVPVNIVGVRYDTGIIENYATAGAIIIEASPVSRTDAQLTTGANYNSFTLINTWRYYGQNTHTTNFSEFARRANKYIYDDEYNAVEGTTILYFDPANNDYRLHRYTKNGSSFYWKNIGQDIILDLNEVSGLPSSISSATLLASESNPQQRWLSKIAFAWTRKWDTGFQEGSPFRDKIAFINPTDKHRLLYNRSGNTGTWEDIFGEIGEYSFNAHRGQQFYRKAVSKESGFPNGIRSLRVFIPGLAETDDIRQPPNRILALRGSP